MKGQFFYSSVKFPGWTSGNKQTCNPRVHTGPWAETSSSYILCRTVQTQCSRSARTRSKCSSLCLLLSLCSGVVFARGDLLPNLGTICRFEADGDSGQCNGGSGTRFCASVGDWTGIYRDNTDNRAGGCRMSWRITVRHQWGTWGADPKTFPEYILQFLAKTAKESVVLKKKLRMGMRISGKHQLGSKLVADRKMFFRILQPRKMLFWAGRLLNKISANMGFGTWPATLTGCGGQFHLVVFFAGAR